MSDLTGYTVCPMRLAILLRQFGYKRFLRHGDDNWPEAYTNMAPRGLVKLYLALEDQVMFMPAREQKKIYREAFTGYFKESKL